MTERDRRGFTLVELLIAVVLLLTVSAAIYQLLVRTQRVSREQSERIDLQSNVRAGALILAAELREVGYDDGAGPTDLLGIAVDSIAFRAVRSSGIICNVAANTITIDAGRNYSAYRLPVAGRDSLMLHAEFNVSDANDDVWVRRPITNVATTGVTCPASFGSRPGIALTTPVVVATDGYVAGSPVRTFEPVVYKLYQSGGKNYLGTYSKAVAGEVIQPVLGPLAASGFQLTYLDSLGVATTVLGNIRSIRVTLLGTTDQKVNVAGGFNTTTEATDRLQTVVTLRNMLR